MISWFDFTSLHSMAKETHLSVSSSPSLSVTPLVIFTQVNRNSTAASSVPALKLKKQKTVESIDSIQLHLPKTP